MSDNKYDTGGAGKGSNMNYDDSAFLLFAVSFLIVIWVPMISYRLFNFFYRILHKKTPIELAREASCTCSFCQEKTSKLEAKEKKAQRFRLSDIILIIISILLALSSYQLYNSNLESQAPFDPFEILSVTKTATEREIKKSYRRLAVKYHPDKNRGDPTAATRFIEISKAFAALTDETAKENYIKYGNPDGYIGTTFGIGLPGWVGASSNGFLFIYLIVLLILFPTCLGFWWNSRKKELSDQILTSTFQMYGTTVSKTNRFRDLLAVFCASDEFSDLYRPENEETLITLSETLRKTGNNDIRKTRSFQEPTLSQRQNLLVMSAYLARIPIPEKLEYVLEALLMRSEILFTAMGDTVGIFGRDDCKATWPTPMRGHTVFLSACIAVLQGVIQARDEKVSPLVQIPHFTEKEVKYCTSTRSYRIKTIYDFVKLSMSDHREILRNFTNDQLLDVKSFCDRFPNALLNVTKPYVEEEENEEIHYGERITIKVNLVIMRRNGSVFSPHTPNLPFRKSEAWWIWIADQRLLCPISVKRLTPRMARGYDENIRKRIDPIQLDDDDDDNEERKNNEEKDKDLNRLAEDPRVTIFDVEFSFMAPKVGEHKLEIITACDCYNGTSRTHEIKLNVLPTRKEEENDEPKYFDTDDELGSSDEEDEEENETETENENEYEYEYEEIEDDDDIENDFDEDTYGITSRSHGDPTNG